MSTATLARHEPAQPRRDRVFLGEDEIQRAIAALRAQTDLFCGRNFWVKAAGVYKGRPESIDGVQVRKLAAEGMGPTAIARALGISRPSVYKRLAEEA